MRKGDISNELPKRVIVTTDTFLDIEIAVKKVLKVFPVSTKDTKINRSLLSRLYMFTQ
jgi:hypothetical protein